MNNSHRITAYAVTLSLLAITVSCASGIDLSKIPPPQIVIGTPSVEPKPQPEPEPLKPRATLAFQVFDECAGAYVSETIITIKAGPEMPPAQQVNADGYAKFDALEHGRYDVAFEAGDYAPQLRSFILSENRTWPVRLTPSKGCAKPEPPAPPVVSAPPVVTDTPTNNPPTGSVFAECSATNNTLRISRECVEAVARTSMFWRGCAAGSQHDCHYYSREVALALSKAQNDPRWGIVAKPSGENVDGYSEDVVAYLPSPLPLSVPTWQWRGVDLVGGSGAPGARFQWGELHAAIKCGDAPPGEWCNRPEMTWAPVPR